jgi:hypothetical protein
MLYKKLYFALGLVMSIALLIIYFNYNPARYSFFPKCPFHTLTGFDCPGCGSQRAVHAILHGDFKAATGYNLLLVISVPFLLIHFGYKIKSLVLNRDIRWAVIYHPLTPKIIFAVVVVFWIMRNIPIAPFNYLSAGH